MKAISTKKLKKAQQTISPAEFADIHAELPDGAFWALAEEHGLMPEDFIDEEEEIINDQNGKAHSR